MNWQELIPSHLPRHYTQGEQGLRWKEWAESWGQWLDQYPQTELEKLPLLDNPYTVPIEFAQNLADLIGLRLSTFLGTEDYKIRRQLVQAVDWYKIKGTYAAVNVILYTANLNARIYDLWTSNYQNFVRMPWFCTGIGEGLDGGLYFDSGLYFDEYIDFDIFYKSPHFDIEVELNKPLTVGSTLYLLTRDQFVEAQRLVEVVRPINTVPHWYAHLYAETDESRLAHTITESNVSTTITNNWILNDNALDSGLFMDDDNYFDWTRDDFFDLITKFAVGTGNVGVTPVAAMTGLQTPVIIGDIVDKVIYADRIVFLFDLDAAVDQSALTEFGLFNAAFSEMYVIGTHPAIDKVTGYSLRYEVTVYFGTKY